MGSDPPRLDAYHFHEKSWDSYDHLREAFEWEVPERFNMARYVCDRWVDGGDRVALYDADADGGRGAISYASFRDRADALASYLSAQGVERGDRVGVNAPQKPATAVAHVACWKLGAVSVPLSTLFGTEAVRYRLEDAGAVACVVDDANVETFRAVADDLADLETVLTVDVDDPAAGETPLEEVFDADRSFETVDTAAEDDAIIIYTSGTTGDPKGVRHAHRVLLGNLPLFLTSFCNLEVGEDDVYWTPAEWAWVATLFDVVFPGLFYGRPVVAYEGEGGFDPAAAFGVIETFEVTNVFAPPTALRMMMQVEAPAERWDLDSVRVVPSGGESLGQSIVDWAADVFDGAAVHEGYGQTEANMLVGDCTALTEFREGTIGPPGPGHEVRVLELDSTEPVPPGETGEIAVRYGGDPVCFKEYWNKPEQTAAKVEDGWLRTEDLGSMDEDDYVTFLGRTDGVIISAGYRIGPVEIEEALAAHESVADAGVIGVSDEERGEVPKAFVVAAEGVEPDAALERSLRQHVRDRLAEYEYPREIEFIDELPTTATGKLRRRDLEERAGLH